jgi:hypothetical protein
MSQPIKRARRVYFPGKRSARIAKIESEETEQKRLAAIAAAVDTVLDDYPPNTDDADLDPVAFDYTKSHPDYSGGKK